MAPRTKVVIFDFDGTLFDTHSSIAHALSKTFSALLPPAVPPPTAAAIVASISTGASLGGTITLLYPTAVVTPPGTSPSSIPPTIPKLTPPLLETYLTTYRSLYSIHGTSLIKPFPNAKLLLQQLHARSIPVAIVSNKGVAAVRTVLAQNGLDSLVDIVVGDGEPAGVPRKPDPGSWTTVVKKTFQKRIPILEAESVIVVGDTVADIQYAHNIGARAVWCRYGYGGETECMAKRPDVVVNGLEEIVGLL
jgi:phosphoglycolate phosphatase